MPDDEPQTTWTPKRGRVFQIVVWMIIGLITAGVLGGLWIVLAG